MCCDSPAAELFFAPIIFFIIFLFRSRLHSNGSLFYVFDCELLVANIKVFAIILIKGGGEMIRKNLWLFKTLVNMIVSICLSLDFSVPLFFAIFVKNTIHFVR